MDRSLWVVLLYRALDLLVTLLGRVVVRLKKGGKPKKVKNVAGGKDLM